MKKYNIEYEKLSAYIDGELPLSEKEELEQKLSLSADLRKKLEELKKLKDLTSASYRKLPESHYLETRVMANVNSVSASFIKRKWVPVAGLIVVTAVLMIILKFNPQLINRLVEEQTTNLAAFYKENLKPLLYASNLSNEDIFNFAFYKELPLDNNNEQYLRIGHDDDGEEYFEIKKSTYNTEESNYEKFISALSLNETQTRYVDSILQHYAAELQNQVLVSDRNTVAINPNLWNYNTAIAADIVKFASQVNEPEMKRLLPQASRYLKAEDMERMIVEVKANNDNNYIFLTPDTIFTSWVDVESKELKVELARAREEIVKANRELSRSFADKQKEMHRTFIALKFDSLYHKEKGYKKERFNVRADRNNYRVVMPEIHIPQISVPDMDSITASVDNILKRVHVYTTTSPKSPSKLSRRYNFQYGYGDSLRQMSMPDIPNMDSLMRGNFNFYYDNNKHIDSVLSLFMPEFKLRQDSLTSYFKLYQDSARYMYESDLQEQLKEMESEMRKFREEMHNFRRELKSDTNEVKSPKVIQKPIEI
jgi:hypothetical protein